MFLQLLCLIENFIAFVANNVFYSKVFIMNIVNYIAMFIILELLHIMMLLYLDYCIS